MATAAAVQCVHWHVVHTATHVPAQWSSRRCTPCLHATAVPPDHTGAGGWVTGRGDGRATTTAPVTAGSQSRMRCAGSSHPEHVPTTVAPPRTTTTQFGHTVTHPAGHDTRTMADNTARSASVWVSHKNQPPIHPGPSRPRTSVGAAVEAVDVTDGRGQRRLARVQPRNNKHHDVGEVGGGLGQLREA